MARQKTHKLTPRERALREAFKNPYIDPRVTLIDFCKDQLVEQGTRCEDEKGVPCFYHENKYDPVGFILGPVVKGWKDCRYRSIFWLSKLPNSPFEILAPYANFIHSLVLVHDEADASEWDRLLTNERKRITASL